jgi:hypothetical protein
LFFLVDEIDPENWIDGVNLMKRVELLVHTLKLVRWVDTEAENVPTGACHRLNDESATKFALPHANCFHLQVGDGHVEVLGKVSVPYHSHIRDIKRPEIALVRGEVPNALHMLKHLPPREHVFRTSVQDI